MAAISLQQSGPLAGYLSPLVRGDDPGRDGRVVGADPARRGRSRGAVARRVEADAQELQVAEHAAPQRGRILGQRAGEGNGIHPAEGGRVGADVFADAVGLDLQRLGFPTSRQANILERWDKRTYAIPWAPV